MRTSRHQNPASISLLFHACNVPCPSHPPSQNRQRPSQYLCTVICHHCYPSLLVWTRERYRKKKIPWTMEGFKQVTENACRAVCCFLDILQATLMQVEVQCLCLMYCECNQYDLLQSVPLFIRSGTLSCIVSPCNSKNLDHISVLQHP